MLFHFSDLCRYLANHLLEKDSNLDNLYQAWLASTGQFQMHRNLPRGEARGQNLGDLQRFGGGASLKETKSATMNIFLKILFSF